MRNLSGGQGSLLILAPTSHVTLSKGLSVLLYLRWLCPYLKSQLAMQAFKKSNVRVARSSFELKFRPKFESTSSSRKHFKKSNKYEDQHTNKNTPSLATRNN